MNKALSVKGVIYSALLFLSTFVLFFNLVSAQGFIPPKTNQFITYTGNITNLSEMQDVSSSSPSDGQFLRWVSATSKWTKYTFSLSDFWDFDYNDLINKPTFGNIFNQNLNTTDNVTFANVSADFFFGDGSQLTGVVSSAEDYSLLVSVDNITGFPTAVSYFTNDLGYYNSTNFNINDYYLKSNPFGFYNVTTAPTYINDTFAGNYSTFLTHIDWATANNGTLAKITDLVNYNSTGLIINWSEEIDTSGFLTEETDSLAYNGSLYLTSNPFGFYNSTTLPDLNSSGLIKDWNSTGYLRDWNSTGLIINWSGNYLTEETDPIFSAQNTTIWGAINGKVDLATILGFGYYNSTSFNIADYVLTSNLVSLIGNWSADKSSYSTKAEADLLYATIDEPLWTSNFTAYNSSWSAGIDWATATNGTLVLDSVLNNGSYLNYDWNSTGLIINWSVDTSGYATISDIIAFNYYNSTNFDIDDYLLISNWNATNESYYLANNPFGFYNSTTIPTYLTEETNWNANYSDYLGLFNWNKTYADSLYQPIGSYLDLATLLGFNYYNSTNAPTYINDTFAGNYSTFLTHITWAEVSNGTMAKISDLVNYNSTGLIINWSEEIDVSSYATLSEILAFGYYNSTSFNINDYATLSTLNNGTYNYDWNSSGLIKDWNSTGLIINWSGDFEDTDTTYTAGSNLTLTDTTFSLNTTGVLSWLEGIFVKISDVVSLVGNWSADKSSYYTSAQVDSGFAPISEPLWSANFSAYNSSWSAGISWAEATNGTLYLASNPSGYIVWGDALNGTLASMSDILGFNYWNASYYGGIGNFSAWDKDYDDLINKPTIPTNVSQLVNDFSFYNSTTIPSYLQNLLEDTSPQLGGYLDTNGNNLGATDDEIDNIYMASNKRLYLGNGQESSIYFNGTHTIIG